MTNARSYLLMLLFSLLTMSATARQKISLKDVVRLDLSEIHGGFFSHGFKKVEVVREKGIWKSYHLRDSLTRNFLKDVSEKELVQLIRIVNATDTSIRTKQFNMRHHEMAIALAKLIKLKYLKNAGITSAQQMVFLKALRNKKRNELLLRKLLIPEMMDDRSRYKIEITMNSGENKLISALNFGTIYNLPWEIDGKVIYNPYLSRIYASLVGNKDFDKQFKEGLYRRMIMNIYRSEFRTPFSWANLQTQYPVAVSQLGGTLHMEYCGKNQYGWSAGFRSSLLPKHFTISGRFKQPDTVLVHMKQLENRLVNLQQSNHYLFTYLQPDSSVRVRTVVSDIKNETDSAFFEELKIRYRKILPVRFEEVTFMTASSPKGLEPVTRLEALVLLPDNSLILVPIRQSGKKVGNTGYVYNEKGDLIETLANLQKLPYQ